MKKYRRKIYIHLFSLIEMVVVLIILMLLAGIATPMVMKHFQNAKKTTAVVQVKILKDAVNDYILDIGSPPESLEDLQTNGSGVKKWDGPYLETDLGKDPWGNEYIYKKTDENGRGFEVLSYGSDSQPGGEGNAQDISCWKNYSNN